MSGSEAGEELTARPAKLLLPVSQAGASVAGCYGDGGSASHTLLGKKKDSALFTHPPTLMVGILRDTLNLPAEGATPPLHSPF